MESANKSVDIDYLKQKVEAGCDFVTTQMFFDNSILYSYLYRIREKGIQVPVIAGIMPVTNAKQIRRITQMSGTYLPSRFMSIVDRFGDNPAAMKQAGIAYATDQIIDLIANGVNGIHVYSMNKPDVAMKIKGKPVGDFIGPDTALGKTQEKKSHHYTAGEKKLRRTNAGERIPEERSSGEKTYGHTGRRQEGGPPLSGVQGTGG